MKTKEKTLLTFLIFLWILSLRKLKKWSKRETRLTLQGGKFRVSKKIHFLKRYQLKNNDLF